MGIWLRGALRTYESAVRYPPNQTFIGNLSPEALSTVPRPWHDDATVSVGSDTPAAGPFGEIVPQSLFYALLAQANVLQPPLIALQQGAAERLNRQLACHPVLGRLAGSNPTTAGVDIAAEVEAGLALALQDGERLEGCVRGDRRAEGLGDANLDPYTLLEALCSKASGAVALMITGIPVPRTARISVL